MRRGKQRLEIIMSLQESLLRHKDNQERDEAHSVEISPLAYDEIVSLERSQVIDDRNLSIKHARKEDSDAAFLIQNSRDVLRESDRLDPKTRAQVKQRILDLLDDPRPAGVRQDPASENLLLSVPETSVDILYHLDRARRRIRILSLEPSKDTKLPNA